jgi:hypothetical protein
MGPVLPSMAGGAPYGDVPGIGDASGVTDMAAFEQPSMFSAFGLPASR